MINVDMRRGLRPYQVIGMAGRDDFTSSTGRADYLIHPDRSRRVRAHCWASLTTGKPTSRNLASLAGTTRAIADIVPDHAARPDGIALAPALFGRDRMGRRHRNNPVCRDHGAGCEHQEHLASGSARSRCLSAAVLALLIARSLTRADHPADRGRSGGWPKKGKVAIPVDARGETGVLARARLRKRSGK